MLMQSSDGMPTSFTLGPLKTRGSALTRFLSSIAGIKEAAVNRLRDKYGFDFEAEIPLKSSSLGPRTELCTGDTSSGPPKRQLEPIYSWTLHEDPDNLSDERKGEISGNSGVEGGI